MAGALDNRYDPEPTHTSSEPLPPLRGVL